jgi:alginate O-acetyltransferase complex protein AlgI
MTFIDFGYVFVFLPLVIGLYHLFRTTKWANVIVLLASYYFYGSGGVFLLLPLIFSSLLDYWMALKIDAETIQWRRRLYLTISIVANMGLLMFFKYASWAIQSVNGMLAALDVSFAFTVVDIPLLPGISFYTFQTMSYTLDVYLRHMKPSRHLVNYLAFVTYWPHLVAGPIMRARNLLQQLETVRPVISPQTARFAILLILYGIAKKVVLADNFGYLVEQIDASARGGSLWTGAGLLYAYAFAGQIYCDFSAYTTIARGSALLMGVELSRNFLTPYLSATPSEFWRRWHISLSSWLRDYLYIPLGGSRKGKTREYANVMITMLLGGLWHGASLLFVLWGLWHGLLLVLYRVVPIERVILSRFGRFGKILLVLITFHLVCFGWILFRADTATIMPLLHSIAALVSAARIDPIFFSYCWGVGVLGAALLLTDYPGWRRDGEFEDRFIHFGTVKTAAATVLCYLAIVLLAKREGAQFVYFQF